MTLYLSEGMIARSFWEELESSLVDGRAEQEAMQILEDSRVIEVGFPSRTGSISLQSIKTVWLLANYFQPVVIVEVGTYIGRSTLAMVSGAGNSLRCLFTCDITFDTWKPPTAEVASKVQYFGKTSSTDMLRDLVDRAQVDLFLLDGRIQKEDLQLIRSLRHDRTVFLIDDFEGVEKGVDNALKLRNAFPDLMLLAPPATLSDGWSKSHSLAVLLPTKLIQVSRQQRLPLWMM
jgi:predicted O-methyltransferase YrrM